MAAGGLEVIQIAAGPIETNAFLVMDRDAGEALIIDAPPEVEIELDGEVVEHGVRPVALMITHTHWDHIGDVAAIADRFAVPVIVHEIERDRLEHPGGGPIEIPPAKVDRTVREGDEIALGSHRFVVLHTPGHSPGQISLYSAADDLMFGGDTLFPNGYGRVDIPGASEAETLATIRRLLTLPDAVTVYTGHGLPTTVGKERHWMELVDRTGKLL
ncbi:MAG TPA: MBL fold metallo-hydrolase [Thermomicrobiales bacterium]|nr:MBL fold metallo-hydrolase [Thermomicrobiales bacterium]